ncbi:hypothetical protein K431DRAFT_215367 [Polychaeton citri CBS 116435]|uniref:Coenzyme Q-binding protein COQ10 START domain-containing protein n=1 Tax=Polychaeton citri CBS 116435 TaxID=1314669 RepID=A0A9P4QIP5_9PEZI|nr:hypothetical protein K431DRAFT_215367 [Polychaeton citri CBS 116435]
MQPNTRRSFLTGSPQTLVASRLLRYPANTIFEVISDIANYKTFVPYCVGSHVTKYSNPAKDGKTYPEEAKLVIGFNDQASDEFCSRVYCVPNTTVEAVSGATNTSLPAKEIAHHNQRPPHSDDLSRQASVLSHLATTWTLNPYPYKPPPASATQPGQSHKNVQETSEIPGQERTEVRLHLEFQFANPIYSALSRAAAPKVAEKMIEAFEKRVQAVVEGRSRVK